MSCQELSAIDLKNFSVIKEISVGKILHNIVFSPDGTKAYVTVQGEDKVVIIDTETMKPITEIQVKRTT